MRVGVLRVRVLVRLPAAGRLPGQPVRDRIVGVRMVGRDGGRAYDDFGAVGPQHAELVLANLVRADEQASVALLRRHDRQAYTGVAGRGLDDRPAGLELAGLLCRHHHAQRDAVLDRAAGVEVLDLGQYYRAGSLAGQLPGDLAQPE